MLTKPHSHATNAKPILILSAGKTFASISALQGDFDAWIASGLGNAQSQLLMDAQSISVYPDPSELAGVVVSGSPAMVTDHLPWSENLAQWLKSCVEKELPILGICYGHQLLAYACGGRVDFRPEGIDIGTKAITLTAAAAQDPLFSGLLPSFPVHLVHSQSALKLPEGATLLAVSEQEPHQAFRIGSCAWGVQFHPEFSATIMRSYIDQMQALVTQWQGDPQALKAAIVDTPEASLVLARFAHFCGVAASNSIKELDGVL